jgi:hypothetical protein
MTTQVTEVPVTNVQTPHTATAQTRVDEIRAMREKIPNFVIPESNREGQRLGSVASLPPQFIELAAVAIKNTGQLSGAGADPEEVRDLMAYADAYDPLADEFEAMAGFIRHSVTAARHRAGSIALTTYALAQRLAKRKETADLAPHVTDMRNALGKRIRRSKAQPAPAPETPTPAPVPVTPTSPAK